LPVDSDVLGARLERLLMNPWTPSVSLPEYHTCRGRCKLALFGNPLLRSKWPKVGATISERPHSSLWKEPSSFRKVLCGAFGHIEFPSQSGRLSPRMFPTSRRESTVPTHIKMLANSQVRKVGQGFSPDDRRQSPFIFGFSGALRAPLNPKEIDWAFHCRG